jgi:hypothetical protein
MRSWPVLLGTLTVALPAAAEPSAGPELMFDVPVPSPAPGSQEWPAAVWTGAQHFVVWLDSREAATVMGARVKADGTVVDPRGIVLFRSPVNKFAPHATWDGQNVLVTWVSSEQGNFGVYGVRVAADGTVKDSAGPRLSMPGTTTYLRATAWNGTHHLMLWATQGSPRGWVLSLARVTPGMIMAEAPTVVSSTLVDKNGGSLAVGGDKTLVVWSQPAPPNQVLTDDIYGAVLSGTQVQVTDRPLIEAPNHQSDPVAGWNGTSFLVTYSDGVFGGKARAVRVGADGTVLTPGGFDLFPAEIPAGVVPVQQARVGDEHLIAWRQYNVMPGLYTGRLAASGTGTVTRAAVLAAVPMGDDLNGLGLSVDGPRVLATWSQRPPLQGERDVMAARLDDQGAAADAKPWPVAIAGNGQEDVAVSSNGNEVLAVWRDFRTPGRVECWAARLGADGVSRDPASIPVATGPGFCAQPGVAWNGTEWLVTWLYAPNNQGAFQDLRGARVGRDGKVLDAAGIDLATNNVRRPAVASDGNGFLVLWDTYRTGTGGDVLGLRVGADGKPQDQQPLVIAGEPQEQGEARLVWNGASYLVVWSDSRYGSSSIFGARVGSDGKVVDQGGFPIVRRSRHTEPRVAWNGTHHLVTWTDADQASTQMRAGRVSKEGQPLDGDGVVIPGAASSYMSSLAWAGGKFVTVWRTFRAPVNETPIGSLWLSRIDGDGKPVDASPFQVGTAGTDAFLGPVVAEVGGRPLIAYGGFDSAQANRRIRARFIDEAPGRDAGADGPVAVDAAPLPAPDAGVAPPDVAPDLAAADADAGVKTQSGSGGCGCALGGSRRPALVWSLLVAAALSARRRPSIGWPRRRSGRSRRRG